MTLHSRICTRAEIQGADLTMKCHTTQIKVSNALMAQILWGQNQGRFRTIFHPLCLARSNRRGKEGGPILQRQSISLQLQEEQSPSPRCIYPISEKGQGTLGDAVGYIEVPKQCSKGINIESWFIDWQIDSPLHRLLPKLGNHGSLGIVVIPALMQSPTFWKSAGVLPS